jgi:hypothetical protein
VTAKAEERNGRLEIRIRDLASQLVIVDGPSETGAEK